MGGENSPASLAGMIDQRLSLDDKQVPTVEAPKSKFAGRPFWVRYGEAKKVQEAIKARLEREGEEAWTPEGQKDNIRLRRAFHDALGVQQIVMVFSDDLLRNVYELPWWKKWAPELEPLFKKLGIKPTQVIRCLLARLPKDVTITVHHDTGHWALRSHRVHLPIITSEQDGNEAEQVVFKVGYSDKSLERVPFKEGDVIELNNRAKHFVENNWDKSRVHLIFDYVEAEDAPFVPRTVLSPGQEVFQTRRAIFLDRPDDFEEEKLECKEDRKVLSEKILGLVRERGNVDVKSFISRARRYADGEVEAEGFLHYIEEAVGGRSSLVEIFNSMDFPVLIPDAERQAALRHAYADYTQKPRLFFIIGVMKCGTTSLFEYLIQHPGILRSRQKEPHFFDWQWEKVQKWVLSENARTQAEKLVEGLPVSSSQDLYLKFLQIFDVTKLLEAPDAMVAGEATPSYLLGGRALASRLRRVAGDGARLVVILRDPAKRAYSQYQMTSDLSGTADQLKRRGNVAGRSFESLIEEDLAKLRSIGAQDPGLDSDVFEREYLAHTPMGHGSHSYVGRGLYALQLKQWFKVFPRKQFLFLKLDDVSKNPQQELNKVFKFLGLDSVPVPDTKPRNTRSYDPVDPVLDQRLRDFYKELSSLIGDKFSF